MLLVIEDDDAIRGLIDMILTTYGYTVVTAATVQEAEKVKQRLDSTGVDLVIMDINLSADAQKQEGITLSERWLALDPTLPILFLSASRERFHLPSSPSGTPPLLRKPFGIHEFLATIKVLLERVPTAQQRYAGEFTG
jgi:DNA-binding response OmpR family regulator